MILIYYLWKLYKNLYIAKIRKGGKNIRIMTQNLNVPKTGHKSDIFSEFIIY